MGNARWQSAICQHQEIEKKNDCGDIYFDQLPEYHEMQTLPRTTKESDLSY